MLHHLTLRRGDPAGGDAGMKYLYAWAPGTGAFEFPEGGLRLSPEDNLRLQIHYNNGGRFSDVSDSSGVRLFVGPVDGREWIMADPGPGAAGFAIDARSEGSVESTCKVRESVQVLATLPHMHAVGDAFTLDLTRDGNTSNLLQLNGWQFETQLFYQLPVQLVADDELLVRCDYDNPQSEQVRAGPRSEDEMCFAFTYVSPPNAEFCTPEQSPLEYVPGECIDAPLTAEPISGLVTAEFPEFDAEGTLPDGHWVASRYVVATESASIVSVADFTFAGQLSHQSGDVQLDGAVHIVAPIAMLRGGQQNDISIAASLEPATAGSALAATCGGLPEGSRIGTVDGVPAVSVPFNGGGSTIPIELMMWVFFDLNAA